MPAPPVSAYSNQWLIDADEGHVVWKASPPDGFINPMGTVHGGWAMTVLDSALACAVQSALPAGKGCSTVEVKINLTRAPNVGEIYRCEGRMITLGRRTGTAEAKMKDARGPSCGFRHDDLPDFRLLSGFQAPSPDVCSTTLIRAV